MMRAMLLLCVLPFLAMGSCGEHYRTKKDCEDCEDDCPRSCSPDPRAYGLWHCEGDGVIGP